MNHNHTTLQEDAMKTRQLILAASLIFATAALSYAQTIQPVLKNCSAAEKVRYDRNYASALRNANNGVVESALAIVTMMKLDLPSDNFPKIMNEVRYLITHGATPRIRYRACLAEEVFSNPAAFKVPATSTYHDYDAFFSALDESLSGPSLSSN
jgi:hypothetical protein